MYRPEEVPLGQRTTDYAQRIAQARRREAGLPESMGIKIKVTRLPETNEWKVRWIEDGVLDEEKSYYTDDREDAEMTARAMAEEAYQVGYRSVEVFS